MNSHVKSTASITTIQQIYGQRFVTGGRPDSFNSAIMGGPILHNYSTPQGRTPYKSMIGKTATQVETSTSRQVVGVSGIRLAPSFSTTLNTPLIEELKLPFDQQTTLTTVPSNSRETQEMTKSLPASRHASPGRKLPALTSYRGGGEQ